MSDTTEELKDKDVFPAFYSIPEATESPIPDDAGDWWLVAQIKANMTLTKPTLIATDRTGMDFAIIFEDTSFDLKGRGLKKGSTMVVPRARRTEKGEGKKAIVRVEKEDCTGVKAIPAPLEVVMATGAVMTDERNGTKCSACNKTEGSLKKCTGCQIAAYCSKDCQAKAWDNGHKKRCKIAKTMKEIWP